MFPILHLLVFSFTLLQLRHTAIAASTHCLTEASFANRSESVVFQTNLLDLFSALYSASIQNRTGFSSIVAGEATLYPVYGIFLCRGDLKSASCASCVDDLANVLYRKCFPSEKAIIWEKLCMIKYSSKLFFGKLDDTMHNFYWRNHDQLLVSESGSLKKFNGLLRSLADKVKEKAATGDGGKKFATIEAVVNPSLKVYVLGQCTPDLSDNDCRSCLEDCIDILVTDKPGTGRVVFPSCNLRYDIHKFYTSDGGGDRRDGNEDLASFVSLDSSQSQQLQIECGVLVTSILLFGLFLLGSLRRRVHGSWPIGCIILFHSLISILIPILMGLMRTANLPGDLFPIWACFLLFAYGGFDTMTARNLTDNDNATNYIIYYFALFFWVIYVAYQARVIAWKAYFISWMAYTILLLLGILNIIETWRAFAAASKSKGLPEASKQTEHHMHNVFINKSKANEEEVVGDDAASMTGYPYLVIGTESSNIVTTTQVWQCVDKILPSPRDDDDIRGHSRLTNPNMADNILLKEICLSRALFNILLMRCASYSLEESPRHKCRKFVEDGFLSIGDRWKMQKRVFTIIEWELEFLFDFFYTKFYYYSTKSIAVKFKRLVGIAICIWFAIYELRKATREQFISLSITTFRGHSVEVGVTRGVIILIAVGEVVQLCMRIFSNWTIVNLICLYARKCGTKETRLVKTAILFISYAKYRFSAGIEKGRISSYMFKPWKRNIGQYSLLQSFEQKASPVITLSKEVKAAIISSLADHGFALSGGKTSLARNGLADQLSRFCNTKPEADVHVILVWHIATSVCEHHFSTQLLHPSDEHFQVATQLSKYCAYLVVFAPELLSAVPCKTQATVLDTINCANAKLKDTKDMAERCSKLGLTEQELFGMEEQDETLFVSATVLSNHLRSIFLDDRNRGWRILAEFWVELILYLAPTDNATAHIEQLAKGGEFITLLWALLTNAGITSRAHFPTM